MAMKVIGVLLVGLAFVSVPLAEAQQPPEKPLIGVPLLAPRLLWKVVSTHSKKAS